MASSPTTRVIMTALPIVATEAASPGWATPWRVRLAMSSVIAVEETSAAASPATNRPRVGPNRRSPA